MLRGLIRPWLLSVLDISRSVPEFIGPHTTDGALEARRKGVGVHEAY